VWIEPHIVAEVAGRELMLGRLRDPVLRAVDVRTGAYDA